MLTAMDDTLHHQVPLTFDSLGLSDHRFYDKYWFSIFALNGECMVVSAMVMAKNNNVLEGAGDVLVSDEGRQYNCRASRQLRPDVSSTRVGPISYELLEPLKRHRLVLGENEQGHSFDLEFEAVAPPHEEGHYNYRLDGRLVQDYHRFDQVGVISGTVKANGKTFIATKETWGCVRDHSWGLRYNHTGGFEPVTSEQGLPPLMGGLFVWLTWRGADYSAHFQITDLGDPMWHPLDGSVIYLADQREVRLKDVQHDLEFYPGTRRIRKGTFLVTEEDGRKREIKMEVLRHPYAFAPGYGGLKVRQQYGIYRGKLLVEGEVWDVSDAATVRDLEGKSLGFGMGEGPVRIEENGVVTYGHLAGGARGRYPRYGFNE